MNIYQHLIENLKNQFKKDTNEYLFRISMQSDLERVKLNGSTRVGLSDKLWDKLDLVDKNKLPYFPILHQDMIIASEWIDLEEDVLLENGTLKHKLKIYEKPFFTIYKKEFLLEIMKESAEDQANQGRHYLFKEKPLNCLDSLWQIEEQNDQYYVREIIWK